MSAVIGALRGLLSLDTAAFDAGGKRAIATMGNIERRMAVAGKRLESVGRKLTLGLTTPLAAMASIAVKSSLSTIDAQAKLAQSFGTTVKSMQVLDRAADLSGVSMGEVQQATIQLTKRLSEVAETGKGPAAEALAKLRLRAEELQKLSLDERLGSISKAIETYVPAAERAAVASDLFGARAGLLFTRIDSATIQTATDDIERFGVAVSEVQADQIERTNDAISRLGLVGRGVANQLAAALAPVLEGIADRIADVAAWFNSLSEQGKRITAVAATMAAALGPVAIAIGLVLQGIVPLVKGIGAVILAVTRGTVAIRAMQAAMVLFGGPLGLAAVAAVGLGYAISRNVSSVKTLEEMTTEAAAAQKTFNGALAEFNDNRSPEAASNALEAANTYLEMAAAIRETTAAKLADMRANADRIRANVARGSLRPLTDEEDATITRRLAEAEAEMVSAAEAYNRAVAERNRVALLLKNAAEGLLKVHKEEVVVAENLNEKAARQLRLAAETRAEANRHNQSAQEILATYREQELLSFAIMKHGEDSVEATEARRAIEMRALQTRLDELPVAESVKKQIIAAANAAFDMDLASRNASRALSEAAGGAGRLASGLGLAAGQAQAVAGFLASLPGALAGASANIAGLQAGIADLASGGTQITSEIAKYRAELEASVGPMEAMQDGQREFVKQSIDQKVKLKKQELELSEQYQKQLAALGKLGEAGGGAGRKIKEAMSGAAEAAGELSDQMRGISEDGIGSISSAWGDFAASGFRDFEGFRDKVIDSAKRMFADLIALSAKTRLSFAFGMSPVSVGGAAAGVAGAASGGGGNGALGGLLGGKLLGGKLLGGGGLLAGLGGGFSAALGLGGYASAGLFNIGANAAIASAATGAGAFASTIGAALAPLAVVGGVLAVIAKGLSRKYAGTALRGNLGADGFEGTQFDFYKGGFLRSDKTNYSAVPEDIQVLLDTAMQGVTDNLKDMAGALNLSAKGIRDFTDVEFTLWTNGKSAEQIQQELGQQNEATSEKMAQLILKTDRWSNSGESALDTLTRLSSSLTAVNLVMDTLEETAFAVSLKAADMASNLVDLFGGLDAFNEATTAYYLAFYSEQERFDTTLRQLRERFRDLNITMPASRAGFRELVESIDLTSESGRSLYAELVSLSGALDQVLPSVAEVSRAMTGLLDRIGDSITERIAESQELSRQSAQAASLWYRTATTLRNFLRDLTGSSALSPLSIQQQSVVNRARLEAAFAGARGGDVEAVGAIPELAKTYLESLRKTSKTAAEYQIEASRIAGQVSYLAGVDDLQGANSDVLQTLYNKQIEVLTSLGNFLQLEGLTNDQVGALDKSVRKLVKDWDGTVAEFDSALAGLSDAIRSTQDFSLDGLLANLDIAVSLADGAPAWLQELVAKSDEGIRTTLDFIIRRNDLTPPMRWLAVNSVSEHIKSLDFVLRQDLPGPVKRLALETSSELRRNIRFILSRDLDPEARLIALAKTSNLSREITAQLDTAGSHPKALRLALEQASAHAVNVSAVLSRNVTPQGRRLLRLLGLGSEATINLGADVSFTPDEGFQTWYAQTTRSLVATPMTRLGNQLDKLRELMAADVAERKVQARIMALSNRAGNAQTRQSDRIGDATDLIAQIRALEASTGISLRLGNGGAVLKQRDDGTIDYSADGTTTGAGLADFNAAFRGADGLEAKIFAYNAGIKAGADRLEARLAQLRAQIRDLGGVPAFAAGGAHAGGWRMVGERGWEMEHTGPSRVISNREARSMLDNSEVVAEQRRTRDQVSAMLRQMEKMAVEMDRQTAIQRSSDKTLRKLDEVGMKAREG